MNDGSLLHILYSRGKFGSIEWKVTHSQSTGDKRVDLSIKKCITEIVYGFFEMTEYTD